MRLMVVDTQNTPACPQKVLSKDECGEQCGGGAINNVEEDSSVSYLKISTSHTHQCTVNHVFEAGLKRCQALLAILPC